MSSLDGKIAIITGAGHQLGIGHAIATKLSELGVIVVVTDLPKMKDELEETAFEIKKSGIDAVGIVVDVTNQDQIKSCVSRTIERFGKIDLLVNNAGIGIGSPRFLENSEDDWDFSYNVNVKGMVIFCNTVLPLMENQGGGVIINISSLAGLGVIAGMPAPYVASKYAVIGLTKAIALEYGSKNIRAIAVCPGSVKTQMYDVAMAAIADAYQISLQEAQDLENRTIPIGRPAKPREVAEVVAFLASPESSYVTGVAVPVTGGMAPGI
jgi:NAD(P)-dependent dehydrogenase (short-subunit alcohol dehydrogenase family)